MKIDHIALNVFDLEKAKTFFFTYFNGSPNEMYHNPKTGLRSYFITLPDGGRIELMSRPDIIMRQFDSMLQGYIHLSISVGSKNNVDNLTARLKADGFEILSGPRTTGDGYYESCVRGFENNILEITE